MSGSYRQTFVGHYVLLCGEEIVRLEWATHRPRRCWLRTISGPARREFVAGTPRRLRWDGQRREWARSA